MYVLKAFMQTLCVCSTSQVYTQLAEDDKIRYKNEMKSWEDHMAEIGREDLIREQTLSKKRTATEPRVAKKGTKKATATAGKKATDTASKSKTSRKATKSSSTKTVRTAKET